MSMRLLCAVLVGTFATGASQAADLFTAAIAVDQNPVKNFGFNNPTDAINQFRAASLRQQFAYRDTSAVTGRVDYRSLPFVLSFAAESPNLSFQVPTIKVDELFKGSGSSISDQRRNAVEQFEKFLKSDGGNVLNRIQRELVRVSPVDPLAGNPFSLQTRLFSQSFQRGFTPKASPSYGCSGTALLDTQQSLMLAANELTPEMFGDWEHRLNGRRSTNNFAIGGSALFVDTGNFNAVSLSLPFSYAINFESMPGAKLQFELPLNYTEVGRARSYGLGFNIAYTHPVTERWSLTPSIGAAAEGSKDLGTAGGFSGASLTSSYLFHAGDWSLVMGNGVSLQKSLKLRVGGYESDPKLTNTAITNGLLVSGPASLIADGLVFEQFFTDTRIFGDKLYSNHYDELGVSVGRVRFKGEGAVDSLLKGSVSVLVGEHGTHGLRLALNYRF